MKKLTEGRAVFFADSSGKVSREMEVFYNPLMKFNRDISVMLLSSKWLSRRLHEKKIRAGLPLAGSGVRGIRLLLESGKNIGSVHFNDHNPAAASAIRKNIRLNRIHAGLYAVSCMDANAFLLSSQGFDYIDIDPFGSPNAFLDPAVKRISRKGVLAVTATDTAGLAGAFPGAGRRKYWADSLKTEHMHELGLRLLIRKVQLIGMQYDKALVPAISYYKDHYYRAIFQCLKGKEKCDRLYSEHGLYLYCRKCAYFGTVKTVFNENRCRCGSRLRHAGPMYLGRITDRALAKEICSIPEKSKFLKAIMDESGIDIPFFFDTHAVCKAHRIPLLRKRDEIISRLCRRGFRAVQTHFSPNGIKTEAQLGDFLRALK